VGAKLSTATREVLVVVATSSATGPLPAFRAADRDNLRRGVRYRVLAPVEARTIPGVAELLDTFACHGAEIRTVAAVPMAALVVDDTLALLPGEECGELAVFRLPSVVRVVAELFERLWLAGTPFGSTTPRTVEAACAGSGPTGRELDLLALLVNGYTDESAAARLGISVRTVRRMVSELMHRLGARSRFQAGAKTADRGWLTELAG
jgi:DNA-binding CsgD family transcriptional regulator